MIQNDWNGFKINYKRFIIYSKKHQVTSVDDLLVIQNQLDEKVVLVDDLDTTIQKLEQEIASQLENVTELANSISNQRKNCCAKINC